MNAPIIRSDNDDTAEASLVRTYCFLVEKYRGRILRPAETGRRHNILTRAEHDAILRAYRTTEATQAELARRYKRSASLICTIVNGFHPLNK